MLDIGQWGPALAEWMMALNLIEDYSASAQSASPWIARIDDQVHAHLCQSGAAKGYYNQAMLIGFPRKSFFPFDEIKISTKSYPNVVKIFYVSIFEISISMWKSEFLFRCRNRNFDFDVEIGISISILYFRRNRNSEKKFYISDAYRNFYQYFLRKSKLM
jgi:hypothetical protein